MSPLEKHVSEHNLVRSRHLNYNYLLHRKQVMHRRVELRKREPQMAHTPKHRQRVGYAW